MIVYNEIEMIESGWLNGGDHIEKGTKLTLVEQPENYDGEFEYKGIDTKRGVTVYQKFYGTGQLLRKEERWFINLDLKNRN